MRNALVLLALLLSLPLPLSAMGGQEPSGSPATGAAEKALTLYALAEKSSEAEIYSIERMTIPSGVALSTWTSFSLRNGELSTAAASDIPHSKALAATNRADGLLVLEYRITVRLPGGGQQKARSFQEVAFTVKDCLGKKGEILYQPARLAVIRAVGLRKLTSGSLRLAELSYDGGRFTARVEFR
jgi:hypothetical protein